jgi:hypothetical protein
MVVRMYKTGLQVSTQINVLSTISPSLDLIGFLVCSNRINFRNCNSFDYENVNIIRTSSGI